MKIIHILIGKANPNTMNGVNKVVHNLATEQKKLGHNVEVWGITNTPDIIKHSHDYNLKLFPNTELRFILTNKLNKALDSIQTNGVIVHLHSVFLPELFAVSRKLKKNNIPWILSPHSGYNPNSMQKNKLQKKMYMFFFEKLLITGARKVHAIGASEIAEIKQLDPLANVLLLPNGQSLNDIKYTSVLCDKPNERPVFGYCGRLAKAHKGLDLLIQGFSIYKKSGGKGELWLIGDGADEAYLQQLAKEEGSSQNIRFLGALFNDKKLSTIKTMDIFVHTSRWEGMPMSVLESAALGKPLLISKATNMGDYVKHYNNGIVLSNNDSTSISNAMKEFFQLFEKNEIENIGNRSLKLIENELNWPLIAKKMVNSLYSEDKEQAE